MQTFVRVVAAGPFTRAADVMRMPKSTVTRMAQALEKEVGAKLLHRNTRQLSVTQEGAIYYEGALRLINELGQLEHRVAGATAVPIGRIKVEAPGAIVYSVLLPGLPAFFERYPQVQVELGVGNRTIDLIADHVDCVIRLGPIMNEMLVARPLGSIRMITCASTGYLARCGGRFARSRMAAFCLHAERVQSATTSHSTLGFIWRKIWNTLTYFGSTNLANTPYRLVSELDDDRFELQKLEFFTDGTVDAAASDRETKRTMLGVVAVPTLNVIIENEQFEGVIISPDAFEALWLKYT